MPPYAAFHRVSEADPEGSKRVQGVRSNPPPHHPPPTPVFKYPMKMK